jgi:HD-GYP domain-containing protein (c-di-GMP phosphodiesterase class II)
VVAQVGVESAVFLQRQEGVFVPVAAKGVGLDKCRALRITAQAMNLDSWLQSEEVLKIPESPIEGPVKENAEDLGLVLITPFIVYEDLCGLVMLGKSIRKSVDPDSIDVLKIMVRQAAIAYENARYFEEESERSLGVVQTLISLIEENTLARGNTERVANYSYALAKKMEYPEAQYRDFMFGVVLRDIGMIKVSDLIVRSPRELAKEEWEIIKRHPIDGAEMLRKMRFSEHAINIVLYHHERFNGEGYPNKLQGNQIPLGARIVSVVESFAAMLHDRPTRPALTQEEALNTLKENWGMRYDPDVVKAFVEIIEEEIRTGEKKRYTNRELFNV